MQELFKRIGTKGYLKFVGELEEVLADELHGNGGAIAAFRAPSEQGRLAALSAAASIPILNDIKSLDDKIEEMTDKFLEVNLLHFGPLMYEPIQSLKALGLGDYPMLEQLVRLCEDPNCSPVLRERLIFLLGKVLSISLVNSLKSNAGIAGETFAEAILGSVGLTRDEHYRCQYKSDAGSNTDIVLPNVDDRNDRRVEAFVAVQMSTNDRIRLTKSELKQGANAYVITGSGMKAASKSLQHIGTQNLNTTSQANHTLVCNARAIEREIQRCSDALSNARGASTRKGYEDRIRFFSENAISFSTFASEMKKRFLHR